MHRGTTPTFTFTLPFEAAQLTDAVVSFRQPGGVSIDRTLSQCTTEGKTLTCSLTEEETLGLRATSTFGLEIQVRAAAGDTRLASQVWTVPVERILKDGAL